MNRSSAASPILKKPSSTKSIEATSSSICCGNGVAVGVAVGNGVSVGSLVGVTVEVGKGVNVGAVVEVAVGCVVAVAAWATVALVAVGRTGVGITGRSEQATINKAKRKIYLMKPSIFVFIRLGKSTIRKQMAS